MRKTTSLDLQDRMGGEGKKARWIYREAGPVAEYAVDRKWLGYSRGDDETRPANQRRTNLWIGDIVGWLYSEVNQIINQLIQANGQCVPYMLLEG